MICCRSYQDIPDQYGPEEDYYEEEFEYEDEEQEENYVGLEDALDGRR